MEGYWKFLGGGAFLKATFLEVLYENRLKIPEGRGVQNKKPSVGGYGYFLERHNDHKSSIMSSSSANKPPFWGKSLSRDPASMLEYMTRTLNDNIVQERIKRSLHLHYILESTFARILLFLELPFLQGVSIYRENLFPLTSAYKRPK